MYNLCVAYLDPDDQKRCAARHYQRNKKKIKARAVEHNRKARERNRLFLCHYLKEHPCVDCGEDDMLVLDFDHVRGKKRDNVAGLAAKPVSLSVLEEEVAKCDVRCANCHRRKTMMRGKREKAGLWRTLD